MNIIALLGFWRIEMGMKDKSLRVKRHVKEPDLARIERLRKLFEGNECKLQFVLWADGVHLDLCGIWGKDTEPFFRPAICAWEGWKAAWSLKMPKQDSAQAICDGSAHGTHRHAAG